MSANAGWNTLRSLFFLFCTFGGSYTITGQDGQRQNEIQNYVSNHIPVTSQNWEIYQDPVSRYIYFANSAGLVEYNGISTRTFPVPHRQGARSVYVNDEGVVFTGSFEDFGFWTKDQSGGLSYHSLAGEAEVAKNDEIWNIFELNHTLLFQSFTTVYKYDYNTVSAISTPSNMLFFFRAGEKFIAQALGLGLYWFDGIEFTFIKGSEVFQYSKVHAVVTFSPNDHWICTANDGIYTFDGLSFSPLKSEVSEYLREQTCNAGLAMNDSLVVFGTILKGVVFCDRSGKIINSFDYSNGLNNNTVLSLFSDDDDGLWIGLDDGANFMNTSFPVSYYANTNGNLGTIYTAITDSKSLYLGTNHGLFMANIENNDGYYRFSNLRLIPNTQGQVWKLARYGGQILCGHNDGTFLLNGNYIKKISDVTGGWSLKPYGDLLLEGTYTGIISFRKDEKGNWSFFNRIEGYIEPTRFIEVDYLGYVWALHPQKGIYRLELNENADSIVNTIYFSSVADTSDIVTISNINNQVVFLTSGHIYAFDNERKEFFLLRSLEPGLGEYVRATQIIHYVKNSYWFILENRIALFNITRSMEAEKTMEFFHEYKDLPWREQQIIELDAATLLIPTRQAFATINLTQLNEDNRESALKINRLVFSGKSRIRYVVPDSLGKIVIPNRTNNLTVHIANPSWFEEAGREYRYRIPELGNQWYRTATDNFTYLNLRHGSYRLQIREAVREEVTEAAFTIRKPFHISGWAIVIYAIIVAALIAAGVKVFRLELDRHRRLIEYEVGKNKLESELDYKSYELMLTMRYLIRKTDILRELHDKLDNLKAFSTRLPVRFIREMEQIIDHGLDTQTEEWQKVMKNLKLSQEGFFRKLKEKYPSLTPNDLRLCSYLRMNFTTKEIANLTNISQRAVEIGRYRLRRKLNLSHDVNLTEFLIRESETAG
ncbi:MAG: hypothetical protein MUC78_12610 [Bacteroidales bacterium]|jgi:DNA-binding CsgD family transcriptional regulator|nr:hypothetical protein [Bacteroidales bacterium]